MNLSKKKKLASKTLGVGKNKIIFVTSRLEEIKDAITKQDIRDLYAEGAILIKPVLGRRKIIKKKKRRSAGNVRKTIVGRKRKYVILTRKLRKHLKESRKTRKISREEIIGIRNKIKNKEFKNKSNFNEYIKSFNK